MADDPKDPLTGHWAPDKVGKAKEPFDKASHASPPATKEQGEGSGMVNGEKPTPRPPPPTITGPAVDRGHFNSRLQKDNKESHDRNQVKKDEMVAKFENRKSGIDKENKLPSKDDDHKDPSK